MSWWNSKKGALPVMAETVKSRAIEQLQLAALAGAVTELPGGGPHDPRIIEATDKLIDDLGVMKRTRFNAQARLEAKHTASVTAFTLATTIEIALSLASTNFNAMPGTVAAFIEYASQVTAVFILGFGLVVGFGSYQSKAQYLQRSAMDWGNLRRKLQIARPVGRGELQDYRRRYHEIEARCPTNHADVDYRKATLIRNDARAVRSNRAEYFFDVYLVYAVSAFAYVTFWLTLWQLVR